MERFRLSLLVAAAAIAGVPGAAIAQEHRPGLTERTDPFRWNNANRERQAQRPQADFAQARAPRDDRPRGQERNSWRGGNEQRERPSARPPQPAQVAQANPGGERRGWNPGARPDRDGRSQQQRWSGNDGRRDDGRNWNGNNRGNDDRRWDNRDRGDDRRWNGNDRRDDRRWDGRRDDDRRWNDGRGWQNGRNDGWRDGRNGNWNRGNQWRPDWRNDNRYNWRGWRNSNRDLFRNRYVAPRGWSYGYRRFYPGAFLQPFFFAQNYWLTDPWQYRLPPVYGPYQWVRYYDDVLLVDTQTGEVVDVIDGFFW